MSGITKDEAMRIVTEGYLANIDISNPPSPKDLQADLLTCVQLEFKTQNAGKDKGDRWRMPDKLSTSQIAQIMLRLYNIKNIACAGENADMAYDLLAIYQDTGYNEGIYVTDERILQEIMGQYSYNISSKEMDEVLHKLKIKAPRVKRCEDRDLIAVNNGIFNYETKQLLPFDPETVFIAKSHVNYNPYATNVVIHNPTDGSDWDVENWMKELSDDSEIINLLWEILGAIIRPHVRWNKSAWFYSTAGNNGKGTLCELMRNLCGSGAYASIPIADFGKDFMLEPLTRASAIIVDENDVGTFVDKAANLKAVITNDVIALNRKFKTPIAYQFFGFMVQCLNEMPRIKDKSDSFYRRQLFVPFEKCFTGKERKYIKNDYLHRQDVLEYVLYKILNMNYYTLSEPAACKAALEEYKEFNDPVRQFVNDILPQCVWKLLPFDFLYDLYKGWFKENSPSGSIQGRNTFINDLVSVTAPMSQYIVNKNTQVWAKGKMDGPEPFIIKYSLKDWYNPVYHGNDPKEIARPAIKKSYRGIQVI